MSTDPESLWYDLVRRLGRGPDLRPLAPEEAWQEYLDAPEQTAPIEAGSGVKAYRQCLPCPAVPGTLSEPQQSGAPGEHDPTRSMELVWQGQRGDPSAVNELFSRYLPRMRRVLRIKMSAWLRSQVDPEDVLQETLMVAMRKLPELEVRTPASIMQWLAKIADYQVKDRVEHLRAQMRDPARERRLKTDEGSVDSSASGVIVPGLGPTPSQVCVRNELEEAIDEHLEQLDPPDYREVILMRDYYEADWEAIRSELDRPNIDAVQDLYHRAHKRLRERMRKYLS